MAIVRLSVPGPVNVYQTSGGGIYRHPPFMVGSPPQWADNSDDSYADLETFEHPDVSYADQARGALERKPVTAPASRVSVFARIRYQAMSVEMGTPRAFVHSSLNAYSLLNGSIPGGVGSQSPTWLDIPLRETEAGRLTSFLARLNDGSGALELRVQAPLMRKYSYRTTRTRIYEALVIVVTPSDDAPPCRMFPRADGLGVGAGRNYPPPKSQQRSSRGVGFY